MKTEQIKVATEIQSNIEIGSILVREIDITYKYRVRKYDSIKFIILPLKVNTPRFTKFSTTSFFILEDYIIIVVVRCVASVTPLINIESSISQ
jgi:hypothetical protein